LKPFGILFAVERLELLCRDTDVPIGVGLFDVLKAGKIMTEQKFGTQILSLWRLTTICCAEKISQPIPDKATTLRLFKA